MNADIHSMDSPAFFIDSSSLMFIDVNAAMVKLYGYTKEEFLQMKVFVLRPLAEQAEVEQVAQLFEHESFYAGTSHHHKKNGEVFEVRITADRINFNDTDVWLVKEKVR